MSSPVPEKEILAPVELKLDLNFAKMDCFEAVGYFAAPKGEVRHLRYLVLEGFAGVCNFPSVFFEKLEALPSFRLETLAELCTFLYNSPLVEQVMRSDEAWDLWSAIFKAMEEICQAKQGQRN